MAGKVHSHWVCLRSHAHPTADDVVSGMVCLGTDGSTVYMTTSDGTTTAINGSALVTNITIDDDTPDAFRVKEGITDFLNIGTVDGSETLTVGAVLATLTTTMRGQVVNITSGDTITASATGNISILSSGGSTEIGGNPLYLGEQLSTDPVRIGISGARSIRAGSNSATEFIATSQNSSLTMDTNGVEISVKDGEEFSILTQSGHQILGTDFGTTDDITIGDVSAFAGQQLVLDVDNVSIGNTVSVAGDLTVTGNAILNASSNLVVQGGGAITDGTNDVIVFNSSGELTRLGDTAAPTLNHVLTWNGSKWEPQQAQGAGGVANLSDLGDVDNGLSPNANEILAYDGNANNFQAVTVSDALADASLHDFPDVLGTSGTVGQMLMWGPTSAWTPTDVSIEDLHSVNITTGAQIDGYVVSWDNANSEWTAAAPYTNADAVTAVEGEGTLDLTGAVTTKNGHPNSFAAVGGGAASMFSEEISTSTGGWEFFTTALSSEIKLIPGYRYDVCFAGFLPGTVLGSPSNLHPAIRLEDSGATSFASFAARRGMTTAIQQDTDGQMHFMVRCSLAVFDDPEDSVGTKRYVIPAGMVAYMTSDMANSNGGHDTILGWDNANHRPIQLGTPDLSNTGVAVLTPSDALTILKVGFVVDTTQHDAQNNVQAVITGAWVNAFPGLGSVVAGAGSNWPPTLP